jgi:transcriptional regulator with XRE-family HTH domain
VTRAVTISATFEPGLPTSVASMSALRRNKAGRRHQHTGNSVGDRRNPIAALMGPASRIDKREDSERFPVSPPGVIGAAIIKAARRSAGLTRRRLARMLEVRPAVVRAWENGTTPLFCVDYSQIRHLANALSRAGAQAGTETAELVLASQCDLLVTGMLHGVEDYAEVPPVDEGGTAGQAARDLLRWALTGQVPGPYRQYASSCPLLAKPDATFFAYLARELQAGSHGYDLAGYGAALVDLTVR